jgi:hypothetical protein
MGSPSIPSSSASLDWRDSRPLRGRESPSEPASAPEPGPRGHVEPGQVLRRRYTVTVDADGNEWINDVEEWTEDAP